MVTSARDVIHAMRQSFFREEIWPAVTKEEEIAIKEKIRSCVDESSKQSQHNGGRNTDLN